MPVYLRGDSYWIDFRFGAKRYRRPVASVNDGGGRKKAKAAAEDALIAIKGRIAAGTFDPAELDPNTKPTGTTFDAALKLYRAHTGAKGKLDRSYAFLDKTWASHFAGRAIASITSEEIETTLQEWNDVNGWQPATRNNYLNMLSGLFSYAYGRRWIDSHPTEKGRVAMLPTDNERKRWLRRHEIDSLTAAAVELSKDDDIRADTQTWLRVTFPEMLSVACSTGMRFGEVCDLRKSSYQKDDKDAAYLETGKTKNGTRLTYPLEGPVLSIVEALADKAKFPAAYLFPGPRGGNSESAIKDWLPVVCEKAGLVYGRYMGRYDEATGKWAPKLDAAGKRIPNPTGVTFHTFRHTMASQAISSGMSEALIQKLGNWKTASMTKRYAHMADEPLRQAAGTVAAIICGHAGVTSAQKADSKPTLEVAVTR